MTTLLLLIYIISAGVTAGWCLEEARRNGVIHTGEVVAGLFMTLCPIVNTGVVAFTLVMYVEHWCEQRGWNKVIWRRG